MYKKVGERQMVSGRKWLLNSSYAPLRGLGNFSLSHPRLRRGLLSYAPDGAEAPIVVGLAHQEDLGSSVSGWH